MVAQATNPNMEGSAEEPFEIAKAPQVITGTTSYSGVYGDAGIAFDNVAKTPVTFEIVQSEDESATPISLQGRYATINAAGTARVVANASESRNYLEAESVELAVAIAPAQLLVAVDDAQRMEGEANPAFTSSLVSRANTDGVEVSYSCEATEGSPAGEYVIGANVANPNFAATVKPGTLTVEKKPDPDNPDPDNPGPKPDPDPDNSDPDNPDPGKPDPDRPDPDGPGPKPDPDNPDPDNPGPKPDPNNPGPDGPSQPDEPPQPGNPDDSGNSGGGSGEGDGAHGGAASGDGEAGAASASKEACASANNAASAGSLAATADRTPIALAATLGLASLLFAILAMRRIRHCNR